MKNFYLIRVYFLIIFFLFILYKIVKEKNFVFNYIVLREEILIFLLYFNYFFLKIYKDLFFINVLCFK